MATGQSLPININASAMQMARTIFGIADVGDASYDSAPLIAAGSVQGAFVAHEIIVAEGLPTESFLPGPMALNDPEVPMRAEVLTLFPDIDPVTHAGFGPSARIALKSFEAHVMRGAVA